MELWEFEASLIYRVSSRTARTYTEKPCLKKPKPNQTKTKNPRQKKKPNKKKKIDFKFICKSKEAFLF